MAKQRSKASSPENEEHSAIPSHQSKIPTKVTVPETESEPAPKPEQDKQPEKKPTNPDTASPSKKTEDVLESVIKEAEDAEKSDTASKSVKGGWQTHKKDTDDANGRRHIRREYDANHALHVKKVSPLKILPFVIGFIVVAIGVYALVHFVIVPNLSGDTEETLPAATEPPVVPTSVATVDETEPTAEDNEYELLADAMLQNMTLREKICQLFIVSPEVLTGVDNVTAAGDTTKDALAEYPVGGVLYSSKNLTGNEQATTLISNTQSYSQIPLFISVSDEDRAAPQEGEGPGEGPGQGPDGPGRPGEGPANGPQGEGPGEEQPEFDDTTPDGAYSSALSIATEKHNVGFNLDFSLVADTSDIDDDETDDDAADVGTLVSSAIKGNHEGGLIASVKYFPGGVSDDPEEGALPHISRTAAELTENELLPFASAIEANADMIMVGHIIVDDLDSEKPATLSSRVVPNLLRDRLAYKGVVISDSMSIDAITGKYSYSELAQGLFDADVDMILLPANLTEYVSAIEAAINSGSITEAQLDTKVKRVLALKYERNLIPADQSPTVTD